MSAIAESSLGRADQTVTTTRLAGFSDTAQASAAEPIWQPDIADEAPPAADPMAPQPAAIILPEPPVPAATPVPEPFVDPISEDPAEIDIVEAVSAARWRWRDF